MGTSADVPPARWLAVGAVAALLGCRREATPDRGAAPTAMPSVQTATPAPATSASKPAPTSSASVQGAPAASGAGSGVGRFAFDFEDADLPELVRLIGGITGKRFVLTGKLPAIHATVRSAQPVTAAEAYEAFLAILQANGLTVVQSGAFLKIVPSPGVPPEPGTGR